MKYSVLYEPWISVKDLDGKISNVGIVELIKNAHEYSEIFDSSVMHEYAIYRMLFAFLMDAYCPQNEEEIEDILGAGRFSMDMIEKYIEKCGTEGVTFDLFDKNRPFLQVAEHNWPDGAKEVSVAKLNRINASGNNHVHFDHHFEDEAAFSYADTVKALCAVSVFCGADGPGFHASINGKIPVFCIVKGNSLFETLVYGMVPKEMYESYDTILPEWRCKTVFSEEIAKTSLLQGLTFRCRNVLVFSSQEDVIKKMYYSSGCYLRNGTVFEDPYVCYELIKDKRVPMQAKMDRESWRELGTMIDCSEKMRTAPKVVQQYQRISDKDVIMFYTYEVVADMGSIYDARRCEFSVPLDIMSDPIKIFALKDALDKVEKVGKLLSDTLRKYKEEMGISKGSKALKSEMQNSKQYYYFHLKQLFFLNFMPLMRENSDISFMQNDWQEQVWKICQESYNYFIGSIGISGMRLIQSEKCREYMKKQYYKYVRGGKGR